MNYQFQFRPVFANFGLLLDGAWLTLKLSLAAVALGLVVGIIGALFKTSRVKPLQWLAAVYVEVIRNTPFLVQLFFIYFGLPTVGVRLPAGTAALIAMVVNIGAYATEIVRAGIESIHRGQIEAGLSLGMTPLQVFRHIILFPALKTVYPALSSQFILMMLSSSVVSAISAEELTAAANLLQSRTFRSFEIYLVVTGIYLAMSLALGGLFKLVSILAFERRGRRVLRKEAGHVS